MVASYQISERVNAQVVLWTIGSAVVAAIRLVVAVVAWLWRLAPAVVTVAKAVGLAGGLAVTMALVAMIPVTFWLGLGVIVAFAFVTYPRGK